MRRFFLVFFLSASFLVMFFHLRLAGNAVSRLFTVFALVEDHHLWADRWRDSTEDKAVIRGHVYSDKAPLSSFVVLPFYAVYRWSVGTPFGAPDTIVALHLGETLCGAFPFALCCALVLRRLLRERRFAIPWAITLALLSGFGGVLFNYGNSYFGHMLAAGCFLASYVLVIEGSRRLRLAGFLGACAVLAEYPVVLLQAGMLLWLLFGPERWRRTGKYLLGALPCVVALLIYNTVQSGSPFTLAYSQVTSDWKPMQTAFGFHAPSMVAAWELLFGVSRGMFFFVPMLVLLLPMWIAALPDHRRKVFGLSLFVAYWLLISSYFKWDGGWCTGPRHLLPVVALALYEGLGALSARPTLRWPTVGLGAFGLVVNLAAACTNPLVPERAPRPFFTFFWPWMWTGALGEHNLAVEAGLPNGRYLVVVWLALLVLAIVTLSAWGRRLQLPRQAPARQCGQ